ncbi:hypothetical protein D3C87_1839870 [compost metagenome]
MVDAGENFQSVQFGNADIENDQVRHAFANHLHGIDPIIRFADDIEICMFEQHSEGKADDGVIVDDKNGVHNQIPYERE